MTSNILTSDDILLKLCNSVTRVLSSTTSSSIGHAGMVQRIKQTHLRPDLGCFSIFDGGFSGLVVINFSAAAAIEIYRRYMLQMGMPEDELAFSHTSDEVGNVMGELMNQILGDFISRVSKDLQTSISQSQPKMLTINKELRLSIDANLDEPVVRRVSFRTQESNIFYLEFAMDNTQFVSLASFEAEEDVDPDTLIAAHRAKQQHSAPATNPAQDVDDSLFDELGI
ncbi:DUF3334 family protein [Shewanella sp. C32]|uniref:DUF3334 family protein n=1 Tax=Shewanella electrica TaxID=515560 RepID=A0ABT2FQR7_9GAMM|nr:DUF3334 family protein [Shewanella electrica]MCH1927049.1 DUF3334 family protein [Shewanella electrica]MCS4557985.1 DUF3334 family protein [Shewanella electrica]